MYNLKRIFLLPGLLLLISVSLFSQRKPVAKNVNIEIRQNKAIINYEIASRNHGSTHLVFLNFIDDQYNLVTPNLLSGDVGPGIQSGVHNSIVWDISNDVQQLGSDISPVLFIDGYSKQFSNTGGPRNALLSLIVPGLGDYFVADRRMMKFKPYMRTISSLGLIGLGIYVGEQRYRSQGEYKLVLKPSAWRYTGDDKYFERFFEGDIQNFWFKGDKELFISLGAAIWIADILWVFAKGNSNERFLNSSNKGSNFNLSYQQGIIGLNYSCAF